MTTAELYEKIADLQDKHINSLRNITRKTEIIAGLLRFIIVEQGISKSELPDNLRSLIDKDIQKHVFVGRHDRWCEVCNNPDRNPIHNV